MSTASNSSETGPKSGLKAPTKIARPSTSTGGIPRPTATSTASSTSLLSKPGTTTNSSSSSLNQTVSEAALTTTTTTTTTSSTTTATATGVSTASEPSAEQAFQIGDRVFVNGVKPGRLAFLGTTQFKEGEWAGVVLDTTDGKNNGSVNGVTYFECGGEMRGVFCRPNKLTRTYDPSVADANTAAPSANQMASAQNDHNTTVSGGADGGLKIGDRVLITSAAGGPAKIGTLR